MTIRFPVLIAALFTVAPAAAHILIEGKQAAVGADYHAVFVVPHGCAGSPTIKLRVQIPEGVIATEAKPVAGWNVETVKGKYAGEYDYKGGKDTYQGFISLTPGAGHLPSCEWVAPSGGISIQRLTPCSHSCTTGKYSVVSGLRPAVR